MSNESNKPSLYGFQKHNCLPEWRWFWEECVFALPLWEGVGDEVREYAFDFTGTIEDDGTLIFWQKGDDGTNELHWNAPGNNVGRGINFGDHPSKQFLGSQISIIAGAVPDADPDTLDDGGRIISHGFSTSGDYWSLMLTDDGFAGPDGNRGARGLCLRINNSDLITIDSIYNGGEYVQLAGTYSSPGDPKIFVDAVEITNTETVLREDQFTDPVGSGTHPVYVGRNAATDTSRQILGSIRYIYVLQTEASPETLERLAADPYGPFRQRNIYPVQDDAGQDISRTLTDDIVTNDFDIITVSTVRVLVESVLPEDEVSRAAHITRTFLDNVDSVDAINSRIVILKILSDVIAVSDESFRSAYAIRALIEAVVAEDNTSRSADALRDMRDAIELDDTLLASRSVARLLVDNTILSDAIASQFNIALSDDAALEDALFAISQIDRRLIESIVALDSLDAQVTGATIILRTLEESIDIDDSISRVASLVRRLAQEIAVSDSASFADDLHRILSDVVDIDDSITSTLLTSIFRTLVDEIVVNDQTVKTSFLVRLIRDAVDAEDEDELEYAIERFLSDSLDTLDSASYDRQVADSGFIGLGIIATMVAEDIVTAIKRFD